MSDELEKKLNVAADCRNPLTAGSDVLLEAAATLRRYREALEKCADAASGWDIDSANTIARQALEPTP